MEIDGKAFKNMEILTLLVFTFMVETGVSLVSSSVTSSESQDIISAKADTKNNSMMNLSTSSCQKIAGIFLSNQSHIVGLETLAQKVGCDDRDLFDAIKRIKAMAFHVKNKHHLHRSVAYRKWRHLACEIQRNFLRCLDRFNPVTTTTTATTTETERQAPVKPNASKAVDKKTKAFTSPANFLSFMVGNNAWMNYNTDDLWFN